MVYDGDAGGGISAKVPRAGEVIGRYIDIAAAGSDVRDLHIIDRTTGIGIYRRCFALSVYTYIRQPQAFHVRLDSFAFRDIGRHHVGATIILVFSVIGGNQLVQFRQARAQGVGIVKGSLGDASLHPVVGLVVGRCYGQPFCNTAANGQVNGVGSTRNEGSGHVDRAGFWQCLIRRHCVGGQERLVGAGAAQGPVPEALVFGDPFLAAACDDVDVLGGSHSAAHIHRPLVLADVFVVIVFVIFHSWGGNGNYGVVVRA